MLGQHFTRVRHFGLQQFPWKDQTLLSFEIQLIIRNSSSGNLSAEVEHARRELWCEEIKLEIQQLKDLRRAKGLQALCMRVVLFVHAKQNM